MKHGQKKILLIIMKGINMMPPELITCAICSKPAHGIYRKTSGEKVTRCEKCAPPWKYVTGFEPVNMYFKRGNKNENQNN